jgi:hypothetical protein
VFGLYLGHIYYTLRRENQISKEMTTKTLAQLVEEIKALAPEERRERARGVAKAYYKFLQEEDRKRICEGFEELGRDLALRGIGGL